MRRPSDAEGVKIEVGEFYITRKGQKAKIYALDGYMDEGIHGAVYEDLEVPILRLMGWDGSGRYESGYLHEHDLVDKWRGP